MDCKRIIESLFCKYSVVDKNLFNANVDCITTSL